MGHVFGPKDDGTPYIMGVVNVTPDSFSDGGAYFSSDKAVEHGLRLAQEGADILDIGGESTRPGAAPVSVQEEIDRVVPVIAGLVETGKVISVDTRHAQTMQHAVAAGAGMINDISALSHDADGLDVAAKAGAAVCLMHMQGTPETMQQHPHYDDVTGEICAYLLQRIAACEVAGIPRSKIVVDPGIGFGKLLQHNLDILHNFVQFKALDVPVLLGVSRKSFIENICPGTPANDRLPGSLAAALWGAQLGADILRVHDVAATKQAIEVYSAIRQAG